MKRILPILVAAGLSSTAGVASAQVCVQVDTTRDTLAEAEQRAAVTFVSQELVRAGKPVVTEGCAATYVVYHVRFGNSITVYLTGPEGQRQMTARVLEDVPPLYSQMVRSLLTGQAMDTANNTVDRNNVTTAQMAPNRASADSLWYVRLGYGTVGGAEGGPAVGFGYRYELDTIGIDASFFNMTLPDLNDTNNNSDAGASGSWIKLMVHYFFNGTANSTLYAGGGVSWGALAFADEGKAYAGSGIQGEVSVGFEMLRASTIRLFIQADATLPFYSAEEDIGLTTGAASKWAPVFVLSVGLGWSRGGGVATVRML